MTCYRCPMTRTNKCLRCAASCAYSGASSFLERCHLVSACLLSGYVRASVLKLLPAAMLSTTDMGILIFRKYWQVLAQKARNNMGKCVTHLCYCLGPRLCNVAVQMSDACLCSAQEPGRNLTNIQLRVLKWGVMHVLSDRLHGQKHGE